MQLTPTNENTVMTCAIELNEGLTRLRALALELGVNDLVTIEATPVVSEDGYSYTVTLENGAKVEFKSADDKSAKYRAYRIGRDGSKTRVNNLKVTNLVRTTDNVTLK